jgi:nucleotide-binding universal stress UspA family protein
VIVGVSGSTGSLRALRYTADLARHDNTPLVTVLAWVLSWRGSADRRAPSAYLREIWRRPASPRLGDALAAAWGSAPSDMSVHGVIARGEAGRVLVDMAAAKDLLVVGAGKHGPFTRLWHGKVSRPCLSHASCPVLAIPASPLAAHDGVLCGWSFRYRRLSTITGVESLRNTR